MVTPLTGRDELDVAGLDRLVERLTAAGVAGLFVLGTTGEGPSLSYRLRVELISRACEATAGRVPVLVGVTDTAFVESVQLADIAAECGASAAVLAPPYYLPPAQPELIEYVEGIVAEMPLPTFLYNMPSLTKVAFEPETLRRLVGHPRIVGLKDSSGDLAYLRGAVEIAAERPDFTVLIGPEHLLADAMAFGVHGGVSGGANLFPEWFVGLFDAITAGDAVRAAELRSRIDRLQKLYKVGRHASAIIKGIKCGLACLGVCDDFVAEPFRRFDGEEREKVRALLAGMAAVDSAGDDGTFRVCDPTDIARS
jgi:4-hydroxy-tetrahydrodipicolinate synthase